MKENILKLIPEKQKNYARPDNLEIEVLNQKVLFRMIVDDCGATVQIDKDILRGFLE